MLDWFVIVVYLVSFFICFYALSCIKFDRLCYVSEPNKVRLLLLLFAMGLGYLVAGFVLELTIYH